MTAFPARPSRQAFAVYLVLTTAATLFFGFHHIHSGDPYTTGDYLINYSAGFVRRGLIGTLILHAHSFTHIGLFQLVFIAQAIVWVMFVLLAYRLTIGLRWNYALMALLLSPATFSFMMLNPREALRKEILVYAVLAFFCLPEIPRWFRLDQSQTSIPWRLSISFAILVPILVLSHDLSVAFLPYIAAAVVLQLRNNLSRAALTLALPAIPTLAAIIAIVLHPGTHAIAQAVCSSIGGKLGVFDPNDESLCAGSIIWLQFTSAQARSVTADFIRLFHYVRFYSLISVLVFAPTVWVFTSLYRAPATRRSAKVILVATVFAVATSSILFLEATDWGRWISIHAICLMLLMLLVLRGEAYRQESLGNTPTEPVPASSLISTLITHPLPTLLLLAYATLWALPPLVPTLRNYHGYYGLYAYYRDMHVVHSTPSS